MVKITRIIKNNNMRLPTYEKSDIHRIALVATGSWGDNINQTLQLKPLKSHFEKCTLDVHTSTTYANAFYNNPYIDKIVEHPSTDKNTALHLTKTIPDKLNSCGYDTILADHPMVTRPWSSSAHPQLGENLICVWYEQLTKLGIKYEAPLKSVLRLTEQEQEKVADFVSSIPNFSNSRNILMEISAESGQTFWNHGWTEAVIRYFLNGNTNVFVSSRHVTKEVTRLNNESRGRVRFVGHLSIRECAELFNYCQIFQSISSGLSNACNTDHCKTDITWLEVVNSFAVTSAPIRSDGKLFWYKNDLDEYLAKLRSMGI
jgi:hypothetical protein